MDKPVYKSKTMWGFGIVALLAIMEVQGILDSTAVVRILQILGAYLGTYGLRDAIGRI